MSVDIRYIDLYTHLLSTPPPLPPPPPPPLVAAVCEGPRGPNGSELHGTDVQLQPDPLQWSWTLHA